MFTDVYDKRCVKLSEQSCTINDLEEMLLLTGCLTPTQFLNADWGHQLLSARPPWCCSVGEPPTRPTFSFIHRRSESLTASIYRPSTTATGVKWRFFIHTGAKSSHHLCSDVSVTCRTLSRTTVLLLFAFRCFWQRLRLHARRAKHTIHLPFGPLDAEECANTSPPRCSLTGQTPLTGRVLNNPGIPECYIYLLDYTQIKRKVV